MWVLHQKSDADKLILFVKEFKGDVLIWLGQHHPDLLKG